MKSFSESDLKVPYQTVDIFIKYKVEILPHVFGVLRHFLFSLFCSDSRDIIGPDNVFLTF